MVDVLFDLLQFGFELEDGVEFGVEDLFQIL